MIDLQIRHALLVNLADLTSGSKIIVGFSGGADSAALLRGAVHVGQERNWQVGALIVNHQLQPDAAAVANQAKLLAEQLGAQPVEVVPVDVARGPGSGGMEAAARNARRATFENYATEHGTQAVLLGHTLDDQAETVLLGLARGSGARSLSAMRAIDGIYRRPLLPLSRQHVRETVADLPVYEDPHNESEQFARVRVRTKVLPMLEHELGPGIAAALARTADMLREDADALDALATQVKSEVGLDIDRLLTLTPAIRTRVLRLHAIEAGCTVNDLTREHILGVDTLLTNWRGQGPLNLPGHVSVERQSGRLNFSKT